MLMKRLDEAETIPRIGVKGRFFLRKAGGPFAGFFSDGHAPAPAVIVALRVSNFLQEILHLLACSAHTWQTVLSLHSLSTQSDAAPHDKEFS
jgi:hypothetical protein